ncbi:MAG: hypothetical protein J6B92_08730 [Paraprevotella sp.]|nr:hypothetical protein [Paraprevotella sp.]
MNYDIKLYAHGVPMGQKTWGVENIDSNYIDAIYGRRSDVPVQMLVEVRKFGSSANCYYTYLRTDNVCDSIGRKGSYIALTLRVNYYYADVQNMYNLLDAAYKKFIVGSVVGVNGDVTKYLIADFAQADAVLKALEKELNNYLMQFSSDSDFVSLGSFKANGQNEPASINILECDVKTVAGYVKSKGSISISPFYPSVKEQGIIQKMTADINAAKNQAQQDVAEALRDKEAGIQAVRNEYKDADKTIRSLREDIDKANKEVKRLEGVESDLKQKLQNAVAYKEQYERVIEDLNRKDALFAKIRESLSGLGELSVLLSMNPQAHATGGHTENSSHQEGKSFLWMEVIRKLHPFTDFLVMIVLLVIVGITLPKSCEDKNMPQPKVTSSEGKGYAEPKEQNPGDMFFEEQTTSVQEPQLSLKEQFPNAKIDVEGISARKPMKYGDGSSYIVSLINVEGNLDGTWVSEDFAIYENQITPKKSGPCSISYIIGSDTLVTRTILVK